MKGMGAILILGSLVGALPVLARRVPFPSALRALQQFGRTYEKFIYSAAAISLATGAAILATRHWRQEEGCEQDYGPIQKGGGDVGEAVQDEEEGSEQDCGTIEIRESKGDVAEAVQDEEEGSGQHYDTMEIRGSEENTWDSVRQPSKRVRRSGKKAKKIGFDRKEFKRLQLTKQEEGRANLERACDQIGKGEGRLKPFVKIQMTPFVKQRLAQRESVQQALQEVKYRSDAVMGHRESPPSSLDLPCLQDASLGTYVESGLLFLRLQEGGSLRLQPGDRLLCIDQAGDFSLTIHQSLKGRVPSQCHLLAPLALRNTPYGDGGQPPEATELMFSGLLKTLRSTVQQELKNQPLFLNQREWQKASPKFADQMVGAEGWEAQSQILQVERLEKIQLDRYAADIANRHGELVLDYFHPYLPKDGDSRLVVFTRDLLEAARLLDDARAGSGSESRMGSMRGKMQELGALDQLRLPGESNIFIVAVDDKLKPADLGQRVKV